MLSKPFVIGKLVENKSQFEQLGVSYIGLFGSYVRGEQNPDSDIDLLVSFKDGSETFQNFMELCFFLDTIFPGYRVEVVTTNGLSPYIGPEILKEVEYV
ncbi:MAG: nucleotidyltransferase family protein [Lewinellaceae bacterium]|nr:nucleotidyltransferase family protein [Lewinellaceae bacterium]